MFKEELTLHFSIKRASVDIGKNQSCVFQFLTIVKSFGLQKPCRMKVFVIWIFLGVEFKKEVYTLTEIRIFEAVITFKALVGGFESFVAFWKGSINPPVASPGISVIFLEEVC